MEILTESIYTVNCTKVHLVQKVCRCIQNDHYHPFEDNESITAIELPVAPAKRKQHGLTGESNQYGKVLNRTITTDSSVSTQPGGTLEGAESSGQLFEKVSCSVIPNNWKPKDILLTLRDIVNYYMGKVLNTPAASGIYHARQPCFFTPIDYILWSSSAQSYKTGESREICEPSCGGVEVLDRFLNRSQIQLNRKEANNG